VEFLVSSFMKQFCSTFGEKLPESNGDDAFADADDMMMLMMIIIIQFNSCLFTCKLNSTEANYKVSTIHRYT
jgi:phosphotransferase system HPr-like phosphotransfer protein